MFRAEEVLKTLTPKDRPGNHGKDRKHASFLPFLEKYAGRTLHRHRRPRKAGAIAKNCVLGFDKNTPTIENAPALILVMVIAGRSGFERDGSFSTGKEDRWETFDAGIATQTLCLAAYNEGLGTVIMGYFDQKEVSKVVDLPEGQNLAAMVAIGVPDETPAMPKRKSVEELLSYG